ncbi:MAG: alpha/beta fold hydrolase [Dermatophilus congolensis]|nr:alpha/beta fold hydrolase [Dermatophilus congolensis]
MSLRTRVAVGLLVALPTGLGTAVSASATPAPVPVPPDPVVVNAQSAFAAKAPSGGAKPLPRWRWAQYMAQKPTWSARNCSPNATATAEQVTEGKSLGLECARFRTPLDWNDLSKGSIVLNVSRIKSTAKKGTTARGLFLNPGGPGGAAGGLVPVVAVVKPAFRSTHDIVGVDPRGTGLSTPLPCTMPGGQAVDQRVTTKAVRDATWRGYKAWVKSCTDKQGAILPYITTENTVKDHDLVRRVMGYNKLDFFGLSGGSWMGSWYAQLHPATAGRIVIDANTQFTSDWRTSFSHMPKGFQRRWDSQVIPWLARHNADYKLGTTTKAVRASYERIRAEAGKKRIRDITPATLDSTVMLMIYDDAMLPMLGGILGDVNAALKSSKGVVDMPMPPGMMPELDTETLAMITVRTAIICNDTNFDRSRESLEAEYLRAQKAYPLQGANLGVITGPCAYWPYKPKNVPKIDGKGVPTMLMVQTELDPATPIEGARLAHAAHSATRMITVDDKGDHGGVLSSAAGSCVDKAVSTFLAKGTLPARDLTCKGTPLPNDTKVFPVAVR